MKNTFFLLALACLLSCQVGQTEQDNPNEAAAAKANAQPCLASFVDRQNELIDKATVAELFGIATEAVEEHFNAFNKSEYTNLQFQWAGDRVMKMASGLSIPLENSVYVGNISQVIAVEEGSQLTPLQAFQNNYRPLTPNEIAQMKAAFAEKATIEGMTADNQQVGAQLLESAITIQFGQVDGIGEAAVWNDYPAKQGYGGELYILLGNHVLRVTVRVSDDQVYNRQKALELARLILKKCN